MSQFNETMTKEEKATEFRRSMAALEECADGTNDQTVSSQLDLHKAVLRIDLDIKILYVLFALSWIVVAFLSVALERLTG